MKRPPAALLLLLLTLALSCRGRPEPAVSAPRFDWHFLYWMPYDNDLDRCALTISSSLARAALRHPTVAVSLLSDRRGPGGLMLQRFSTGGYFERRLATEDSASVNSFNELLRSATRDAPARRYVLVLLDHGGGLDQLGVDEHTGASSPDGGSVRAWLPARDAAEAVRAWMRSEHLSPAQLPVLFFQQCGRSSVEALYPFRDTAETLLASEQIVGACNTYYEALVAFAAAAPSAEPRALAAEVFAHDRDYESYTLVRSGALSRWPAHARAVSDALLAGPNAPDARSIAALRPCFSSGLERNYDLREVLRAASSGRTEPAVTEATQGLDRWVRDELVLEHRWRTQDPRSDAWCGVATHIPSHAVLGGLYRGLEAYRGSRWSELVGAMTPSGPITIRARPREK